MLQLLFVETMLSKKCKNKKKQVNSPMAKLDDDEDASSIASSASSVSTNDSDATCVDACQNFNVIQKLNLM